LSRPAAARLAGAAFAVLALAACGFQLRGEAPSGLKSLYVSTSAPSQVAVEIRRQLSGTSTRLAASAREAEAHVRISAESTEKLIQSLTGAGRVFDYQLRLHVGYDVADAAGRALVEPAALDLQRIISYSETAPLAKEAEERLLFDEMRAEAATQILRRVALVRAAVPAR